MQPLVSPNKQMAHVLLAMVVQMAVSLKPMTVRTPSTVTVVEAHQLVPPQSIFMQAAAAAQQRMAMVVRRVIQDLDLLQVKAELIWQVVLVETLEELMTMPPQIPDAAAGIHSSVAAEVDPVFTVAVPVALEVVVAVVQATSMLHWSSAVQRIST